MASGGGKGRISNELVAASCAAVLAVYAAGYWRTRDEARRIDVRAQERPARPAPAPVAAPVAPPIADAQPGIAPTPPAPATPDVLVVAPMAPAPTPDVGSAGPTPVPPKPAAAASVPSAVPPPATSPPATVGIPETGVAESTALTAQPASESPPVASPVPSAKWRDGTFTGWGTSRHGDIKAQVVIRDGRIVEASIASCETRYPCDVIADIIPQPVARQSPQVDYVSRATESADAYYYGLVEALKEAQIPEAAPVAAPR